MNKHFVCQIKNARLMTKNKQYINQLNCINKQHNFIVLRTLYGNDYETEMHRSMLLEKLQHIHENLCFELEIRPSNPYREMWPIDFTNKNIKSCQDCGGKFSLEVGSAELTCVNCGRIEILDGTAFAMRKTYNACTKTKNTRSNIDFISFSIVVTILKIISFPNRGSVLYFRTYRRQTTKANMVIPLLSTKSRKDYNKRLTTHDSKIYTNQNTGLFISKTQTKMEFHNTRPTKLSYLFIKIFKEF